jgi:hypothetical protein
MGIAVIGRSVRGPARVADAVASGGGPIFQMTNQIVNATGAFP